MNPNAQTLSVYHSRKDQVLLSCGFTASEITLIEVAPLPSVLKVVELGRFADIFTDEFADRLRNQTQKPFALCLYDSTGWLRHAIPFSDTDEAFAQACQEFAAYVNPPIFTAN